MSQNHGVTSGFLGPAPVVGQWLMRSPLVSVQYGTVTFAGTGTGTATITAGVAARSVIMQLGCTTDTDLANGVLPHGYLSLSGNTVTATGFANAAVRTVSFAVIEFVPSYVRSIQQGTVTITNGNSAGSATITAVVLTKSLIVWAGDAIDTADDKSVGRMFFGSATTVLAGRSGLIGAYVGAFTVVEWY